MSSTTTATTRTLDLPLGTTPDGAPVHWRLTHPDGRPAHGLVVGPAGSGGTTALARIAAGADAAGVRVAAVDLDWHREDTMRLVRPHMPITTRAGLRRELDFSLGLLPLVHGTGLDMERTVLLVDGSLAACVDSDRLAQVVRQADRTNTSVIVRTHRLGLEQFGCSDILRANLSDQYLALGRPTGSALRLCEIELSGYRAPRFRSAPGGGVYGREGATSWVDVTAP